MNYYAVLEITAHVLFIVITFYFFLLLLFNAYVSVKICIWKLYGWF